MEYEIIKFTNNNLELEVNVSPEEETVWLTVKQISTLFGTTTDNVYLHLKNIKKEGEIDISLAEDSSVTEFYARKMQGHGTDGKSYIITYYNLDVILAVGYRVKSKRAIEFRKWANSVLKEYLLKGNAINEERTVITRDNYLSLLAKVEALDNRMSIIEMKEKHLFVEDQLIFDGQPFDAVMLMSRIIETAKESIVMVDPYADVRTLNLFKNKKKDVPLTIITSFGANLSDVDMEIFKEQYGEVNKRTDGLIHDRYLIVDNECFYHLGGSVNYLGKRLSQITHILDEEINETLRKRFAI